MINTCKTLQLFQKDNFKAKKSTAGEQFQITCETLPE
jgi:hypothetical protein